jgi:hypothetical protein
MEALGKRLGWAFFQSIKFCKKLSGEFSAIGYERLEGLIQDFYRATHRRSGTVNIVPRLSLDRGMLPLVRSPRFDPLQRLSHWHNPFR